VSVDGEEVREDLIQENNNAIFIMEDNGDVRCEFDISATQNNPFALHNSKNMYFAPLDQAGTLLELVGTQDGNNLSISANLHPKVMLGIYSDEPGESLRDQLGIKGNAVIVESVIKGLSADQAGIQDHDIIISIDGSDGVSPKELTEILGMHNPGDNIEIVILRKGQKMKVGTKLHAYDARALGHTIQGSGSWTSIEGDQKFPAYLQGQVRVAPNSDSFFSPETRELTHRKILEALQEEGISKKKIAEIEEQIRASLDENVWSAFGKDSNGKMFAFSNDDQRNQNDQRFLVESMQRKAQQAMRDAERLTLEYKDGQLLLKRHADDLQDKVHTLNAQIHEAIPEIEVEFTDRLSDLEGRLDELETILDSRMQSLTELIERLIERFDED
jgi:hypothetical protein